MSQNPTLIPISTSQRTLTMIKLVNLNYKPYDQNQEKKTNPLKNVRGVHMNTTVKNDGIMNGHRVGHMAHTVDPVKISFVNNRRGSNIATSIIIVKIKNVNESYSSFDLGTTDITGVPLTISSDQHNLSPSFNSKRFTIAAGTVVLIEPAFLISFVSYLITIPSFLQFSVFICVMLQYIFLSLFQ